MEKEEMQKLVSRFEQMEDIKELKEEDDTKMCKQTM